MAAALRSRYVTESVETTSPAKLVTMLYDRLVVDLQRAEAGFADGGDQVAGRTACEHALDILTELRASLDTTAWSGGPGLARLYAYLIGEVIRGNVNRDARRLTVVRGLVEPLRDAWHQAAAEVAATGMPAGPVAAHAPR